ncbi:low molecular weight protein-tyrosine-phosphatase [Pleionea litopenaei]|uniref:Low molecular weight protein-tyrosine-phosphatase n=1 Tax=Pleionea litopenaei TaxID=3070815 RepID=A0AA51RV13_9GAMM|nr:low molecular weight protein-tyrosine-phosphatase [Pleionea sp. HL-JVS1]WMS88040.1 low molecular weight protein-tyrosine-phosphatase [Pleionea sp. HL-JVS1]
MIKVLFVCLGNICRSPTAEGVFRDKVKKQNLSNYVSTDSCGTAAYHVGSPPDTRSLQAGIARGYDFTDLRARKVKLKDFDEFDLICAMDQNNYDDLIAFAPDQHHQKVIKFLSFAMNFSEEDVPDPYYGGPKGFERVLDLIEDASDGLILKLKDTLQR